MLHGGRCSAEYVHVPVGQEIAGIGGRYAVMRERRLFTGARVLCGGVRDGGQLVLRTVAFANVPGYLVRHHARIAADGSAVSASSG